MAGGPTITMPSFMGNGWTPFSTTCATNTNVQDVIAAPAAGFFIRLHFVHVSLATQTALTAVILFPENASNETVATRLKGYVRAAQPFVVGPWIDWCLPAAKKFQCKWTVATTEAAEITGFYRVEAVRIAG